MVFLAIAANRPTFLLLEKCSYKALNIKCLINKRHFSPSFHILADQKPDQSTSTAIQGSSNSVIRIWEVYGTSYQEKKKSCLYQAVLLPQNDKASKRSNTTHGDRIPINWEKVAISNSNEPADDDSLKEKIVKKAVHLFLPHGYPHTVDAGYAQYASLCFCSNVAGSAAMVLSTQALLHAALGISIINSSVLSAGINWVIKDGVGQLGGILFASKIGRTRGLDLNPKKWRMLSAMAMDISTFLEICTPMFPGYFLLIASVANVGKNIGFLSASASKAALHQSLQTDSSHNLADLTAKAGSQAILASLLGTTVGIGLSTMIGSDFGSVAAGFVVLSVIHEGCIYQALKAVRLRSFSRHRMHLLLDYFVCQRQNTDKTVKDSVLSPEDVSNLESFFPLVRPDDSHKWLKVGCSLKDICLDARTFDQFMNMDEKYFITMVKHNNSPFGYQIRLAFLDGATGNDLIRGELHAYFARSWFQAQRGAPFTDDTWGIQDSSYTLMKEVFDDFLKSLQAKRWHTEDEYVNIDDYLVYRLSIDLKPQEK